MKASILHPDMYGFRRSPLSHLRALRASVVRRIRRRSYRALANRLALRVAILRDRLRDERRQRRLLERAVTDLGAQHDQLAREIDALQRAQDDHDEDEVIKEMVQHSLAAHGFVPPAELPEHQRRVICAN